MPLQADPLTPSMNGSFLFQKPGMYTQRSLVKTNAGRRWRGKVSFPLLPCIHCYSKSEITIRIIFPKQVLFIPKEYSLVEEEKETLINIRRLPSGVCYPSNDSKKKSYKSFTSNSTSECHVALRGSIWKIKKIIF